MTAAGRVAVIGTAGHVDHGKSALVRALTGTDPDRLAEEKARGMTIDLGFAHLALAGGRRASFVDVPGHEDFIRNMLAGAGGVEAALFVVAADEGPMPQTLEHLAILDLLRVRHGVVALTKADLVDAEWLALVEAEVAALVGGTSLGGAPIVACSATRGTGLEALVAALDAAVAALPAAVDRGRPRLAVDRAFSLPGFGTVVTGTLRDGSLSAGEPLVVLPGGAPTRARGVQSHGEAVDAAGPGTRTALNLAGIEADALARGDVVAQPGAYRPTRLVDVELELLAGAAPLHHDDAVALFHGAAEGTAHVRVIGGREIAPGTAGPAQLRLARPIVVAAGDRFVVRRPSPGATIGGGLVLDPHPRGRRKRFRAETLARFEALAAGRPADVAWHMLAEREPCRADALAPAETGLEPPARDAALAGLAASGRAVRLGELWMTDAGWSALRARTEAALGSYHRRHPLRAGPPPEELRGRLGLVPEAFGAFLAAGVGGGWLARSAEAVSLPGHKVAFGPGEKDAADALLARYRAAPFAPPSAREAEAAVGRAVLGALVARGDLVAVADDVLFDREAYAALREGVMGQLGAAGRVTVADVRDRFATSRKYALAMLEHLDHLRLTRREGDAHVARPAAGPPPGAR